MSVEQNKAMIREWFEKDFVADDLDKAMAKYFDPKYHLTSNGIVMNGVEELKGLVSAVRGGFSDIRIRVEETIGEKDEIGWHFTFQGKHSGDFMGAPATGKEVTITGTGWGRLDNGKLVEAKENWDRFAFMEQIGALPR